MAVTVVELETDSDTSSLVDYTTGTLTPSTNGSPCYISVGSYKDLPIWARSVSSIAGLGLTWSLVVRGSSFGTGGSWRTEQWIGIGTATSGTLVITMNGQAQGLAWSVWQLPGADPLGSIVQTFTAFNPATQTSFSETLADTPDPDSIVIVSAIHPTSAEIMVAGTNFTGFPTTFATPSTSFLAEYDPPAAGTTLAASWATAAKWGMAAAEIAAGETFFTGAAAIAGTGAIAATGTVVSTVTTPTLDYVEGFDHQVASQSQFGLTGSGIFDRFTNAAAEAATFVAGRVTGYALRITEDGVTQTWRGKDLPGAQDRTVSLWFRLPAVPPVDSVICSLRDAAGAAMSAFQVNATTGAIQNQTGTGVRQSGGAVADNAWHRLDFWVDTSTTTWTTHWWVDGDIKTNATQGTHVATDSTRLYYGSATATHRAIVDFDDVVAGTDHTQAPYGDHRVVGALPNVDGTHAGGTAVTRAGGAALGTTTYSDLDEWPATITDYVQQTIVGATNYAEVGFQDRVSARLWGVMALLAANSSGGAANSATCVLVDSTGNTLGIIYSGDMGGASLNYITALIPLTTNWDTFFNGVKARMGYATDIAPQPRWQALMLQYAFGAVSQKAAAAVSGVGSVRVTSTLRKARGAAAITGAGTVEASGVITTSGITGSKWDTNDQQYNQTDAYWDGAFIAPNISVGAATIDGGGTISATGTRVAVVTADGAATIVGAGSIAATGAKVFVGAATVVGAGSVSATGNQFSTHATLTGIAAVTGTGEVRALGVRVIVGAGAISGSGLVAVTNAALVRIGAASIVGEGTIVAAWRVPTAQARFKALYRPTVSLEARYDPLIRLEASVLGVKAPIRKSDEWFQGEDQDYEWEVKATATTLENITDWTIEFRLANQEGGAAVITAKEATVTDGTSGICEVDFDASDTLGLTARTYWYELWRTDATHLQKLAFGPAVLQPSIT